MRIKLDGSVESLLCCSLCKSDLARFIDGFICKSCGLRFAKRPVDTGEMNDEFVFDFRICHPPYCVPAGLESWSEAQFAFEQYHQKRVQSDSLQEYLEEIDSVREIYTDEYHLDGKVLDIGGHQGRLRHYLEDDVSMYVSVDPFYDIFSDLKQQPNLLDAYPCLSEPCNFIAANAEHLPFRTGSFDWIHMRSVIDHFADPYISFLEAYRCTRVGGKVLLGLAIMEKINDLNEKQTTIAGSFSSNKTSLPVRVANKLKRDGLWALLCSIPERCGSFGHKEQPTVHSDDHMFRFTYKSLMNLLELTGWELKKKHWQKAPFQHCLYASAQKRESMS
jgi:SAM-dependent methyltransferase